MTDLEIFQNEQMKEKMRFDEEERSNSKPHVQPEYVAFQSSTAREGQWLNKDNPFVKTYKVNRQEYSMHN